jgi:predicted amidohydrolase YtcJ
VLRIPFTVLALSCVAIAGAQTNPGKADVLIVNGKVYTADGGAFRGAVAIRGNKILQVGGTQEILTLRGPQTDVIDAQGSAVVPGFNDIHTHLLQGGLELANVRLDGARTLAEIQNRIQAFAKAHPERAWIEGMGWGYEAFPGNLPTREQLDALVPDRPAMLTCFDGHSVWVNRRRWPWPESTRTLQIRPTASSCEIPRRASPPAW